MSRELSVLPSLLKCRADCRTNYKARGVDVNDETIIFAQDQEARCDESSRVELICRAMKMLGECGDVPEVQSNGCGGVVARLGALPAWGGEVGSS
jgi:hypothetical protein